MATRGPRLLRTKTETRNDAVHDVGVAQREERGRRGDDVRGNLRVCEGSAWKSVR